MSDQFKTCLTHNHLEGENLACPACLEDIIAGKDARLTALESVLAQCEKALKLCLRWPQVSKNEHINGVQSTIAAIRKVKEQ